MLPCALVAAALATPVARDPRRRADGDAGRRKLPREGAPAADRDLRPDHQRSVEQEGGTDEARHGSQAESKRTSKRSRSGCKDATLAPTAKNLERVRRATLCLLNKERSKRGRVKLRSHKTLRRVARGYARTMVRQQFFDHVSPSGSTLTRRIKSTSYLRGSLRRWEIGENLGWGTGAQATPFGMVKAWMGSPGHRRNILDRGYREIGIGIVYGAPEDVDGGVTYVTEFGTRVRR